MSRFPGSLGTSLGIAHLGGGVPNPFISGARAFGSGAVAASGLRTGGLPGPRDPMEQLQLQATRSGLRRQNQIFDLLLGKGGQSGGLIGGLIGGLVSPGTPDAGGPMSPGAPDFGSPGFPDSGYGAGQRAALEDDFQTAINNALGTLEMRGQGGSSLVGSALGGVAREKSLASGELEDRLFREQLQFRAAERAPLFGLLGQLLGGIGV